MRLDSSVQLRVCHLPANKQDKRSSQLHLPWTAVITALTGTPASPATPPRPQRPSPLTLSDTTLPRVPLTMISRSTSASADASRVCRRLYTALRRLQQMQQKGRAMKRKEQRCVWWQPGQALKKQYPSKAAFCLLPSPPSQHLQLPASVAEPQPTRTCSTAQTDWCFGTAAPHTGAHACG